MRRKVEPGWQESSSQAVRAAMRGRLERYVAYFVGYGLLLLLLYEAQEL